MREPPRVVALSGGVGGAKLVDGLAAVLPPEALTIVVNTGDDFDHWGLRICPDLDTVMYTLAGLAHPEQGWGLAGETFGAFAMVERLGGATWFRLGDRDLGTHLVRTQRLAGGARLTEITADLCRGLGVAHRVLPMCDAPRPTMIDTRDDGTLGFQDWLVRRRAAPAVTRVWSAGPAASAPAVVAAIEAADVVILGPSNPYVSIDPILAVEGVRAAISRRPTVAVSPIVAGRAVKGPLAAMIEQLAARPPGPDAIADHYAGLLQGLVYEEGDAAPGAAIDHAHVVDRTRATSPSGIRTLATATVMSTRDDRARLAREVLAFAETLR
jgi:LPPG:FO 2-phospho-L-lactate transferase